MAHKSGRGQVVAVRAGVKHRAPPALAKLRAANDAPPAVSMGPSLATARVEEIEGDRVRISVRGASISALRDETLHPAVLEGAQRRGERVLVERGEDGVWLVIGALRTQPTPGIDAAREFTIEAERVTVRGHAEVRIAAETASVVVRAEGEIESQAPRIVSQADGLHKITGRTLTLN
jgi:hypothetical protein